MSRAVSYSTRWLPDLYSIRVILASFVPAERRNIAVLPNSENRLDINLDRRAQHHRRDHHAGGAGHSDDRRLEVGIADLASDPAGVALPAGHCGARDFVDAIGVHALFQHHRGGEAFGGRRRVLCAGTQQDLGTAFAIATSLASSARVQLSGNVGYAGSSALAWRGNPHQLFAVDRRRFQSRRWW